MFSPFDFEHMFSQFERVLNAFWTRSEHDVSASLAQPMHSPLFRVFERNVSANRARCELGRIAFERVMSAKVTLPNPSIFPIIIVKSRFLITTTQLDNTHVFYKKTYTVNM